jgi:hypothetical protein
MPKTHRARHRLALLTALAAMMTLVATANIAAYPIGPDGEPLYLAPGQTPPVPAAGSVQVGQVAADAPSPAGNAVPIEDVSSSGTNRSDVVAAIGVVLVAALAVVAAARVLAGYRRRSAKAH